MFIFTYLPQAAVLSLFNGPLAVFSTILLTLSESSTIINILSKTFLIEEALLDTFDGVRKHIHPWLERSPILFNLTWAQTLVSRDMTNIVAEGRQIKSGGRDPMSKLGVLAKKPFEKFTPQAIIRYFMYLPLNFVPVVGTALFITLQGMHLSMVKRLHPNQLSRQKNGTCCTQPIFSTEEVDLITQGGLGS